MAEDPRFVQLEHFVRYQAYKLRMLRGSNYAIKKFFRSTTLAICDGIAFAEVSHNLRKSLPKIKQRDK